MALDSASLLEFQRLNSITAITIPLKLKYFQWYYARQGHHRDNPVEKLFIVYSFPWHRQQE